MIRLKRILLIESELGLIFIETTNRMLLNLPKHQKYFSLRHTSAGFIRFLFLILIFVTLSSQNVPWISSDPFVFAWAISTILFFATEGQSEVQEKVAQRYVMIFRCGLSALSIGLIVFILIQNDPLWVKRPLSILAGLGFLFNCVFFSLVVKWRKFANCNEMNVVLIKASQLSGYKCALILCVNELAIWTSDDWISIGSRGLMLVLEPLFYVLMAKFIYRVRDGQP